MTGPRDEMGDFRGLKDLPKGTGPNDAGSGDVLPVFGYVGLLLAGCGLFVFIYQCIMWLKYGAWLEIPFYLPWVRLGFPIPEMGGWVGLQKIAAWFFEWPLSVVLILVGLLIGCLGLSASSSRN